MLIRVDTIEGIGLLHDVESATDHNWERATLIYGENGRGKSTLASIFSSLADEEPVRISHRQTVDGTLAPKVILQFQNTEDEDEQEITFENGKWSAHQNNLLVFDAYFIERNIYSGSSVDTSHRKNLLQLALGESAVRARKELDKANLQLKKASEKLSTLTQKISLFHSGLTLARFENLKPVENAEQELKVLEHQLMACQKRAPLLSRPLPNLISNPHIEFDRIFEIFFDSIDNSFLETENTIQKHLHTLDYKGAENWIYQGYQISPKAHCPYCAQSLSENDLIKSYKNYFRKTYGMCKTKAGQVFHLCKLHTDSRVLERVTQTILSTQTQIHLWMNTLGVPLDAMWNLTFDVKPCEIALQKLKKLLMNRAQKKVNNPTEISANAEDKKNALQIWGEFLKPIQTVNDQIAEIRKSIFASKKILGHMNVVPLKQKIQELQASQRRHSPEVHVLLEKMAEAKEDLKTITALQRKYSKKLDLVMRKNMLDYESDMNDCLKELGAAFSIQGMAQDIHGMATRSEYGLLLRGKPVHFDDAAPAFSHALSEGDKRTLALAFFITSASKKKDLNQKIIILDDPMCSMDQYRKNKTLIALKKLYDHCLQTVIIAHDLDFLKQFKDIIQAENAEAKTCGIEIKSAVNSDSDWETLALT
jgi:wobble nucleotide-excising tRNase